jgi:prepilin-type N-terminal cleavage/methylation domain-containing protein
MVKLFRQFRRQSGFTLMEVVVATAIFVVVVMALLTLLDYTLKINRRVQALRQVAQGTRNFTETLIRNIRNGEVDYNSPDSYCASGNYVSNDNQALGLITENNEVFCYFVRSGSLWLTNVTQGKTEAVSTTTGFKIIPNSFHFRVWPKTNPNISQDGIQPSVTIIAQFQVDVPGSSTPIIIPYQTTISTDVYDTLPYSP